MIGGHVDMMWDGIPSILSQIRAGTIRALAVGSRERSAALPNVPTAIEEGLPDFESESWFAVAVMQGTPRPLVRFLSDATAAPSIRPMSLLTFSKWVLARSAAHQRSWRRTSPRTPRCGSVSSRKPTSGLSNKRETALRRYSHVRRDSQSAPGREDIRMHIPRRHPIRSLTYLAAVLA